LSNNTAATGGGLYSASGLMTLQNSIVANSPTGGNCGGAGLISSIGFSLDSDGSCVGTGAGDIAGVNPVLGPLQNNGGSTNTQALLADSPAINAIPTGSSGCGTTFTADQRGVTRPRAGACDIGAFEGNGLGGLTLPADNLKIYLPLLVQPYSTQR
ncbi:MAG: hypothetical protein KDJ97_18090, partial [Anaerolineae bacterium]|nr:hypothetical protein [Anaerolineae bacterium]